MTSYICGSFCYRGTITISIYVNPSAFPFQSHTCSKDLHVFVNPDDPKAFNWVLKQEVNNAISPIEGLYNVFLDRTMQLP
jgi:ribosomal protein L24E